MRERLEGKRRDELARVFRHNDVHVRTVFYKQGNERACLVRGNAAADSDDDRFVL
jgi:hypothetical protein